MAGQRIHTISTELNHQKLLNVIIINVLVLYFRIYNVFLDLTLYLNYHIVRAVEAVINGIHGNAIMLTAIAYNGIHKERRSKPTITMAITLIISVITIFQ